MPPATAGWQQQTGKPQPQKAIHRPVSRLFFNSLLTFDEKTTELHLNAEKLTETVLHLDLGQLEGFPFLCSFVLLYVSPLMTQLKINIWGTISRIADRWRTPKLLRLKFHCIWTLRFLFFILFYFILYMYFFFHLFFLFLFLSLLFLF
jgi:hypothetical protein